MRKEKEILRDLLSLAEDIGKIAEKYEYISVTKSKHNETRESIISLGISRGLKEAKGILEQYLQVWDREIDGRDKKSEQKSL